MNLIQINKIVIQEFKDLFARQSFKDLPKWHGRSDQTKFIYEQHSKIYLGLSFRKSPFPAPAKPKEFYQGLWNYDVIEAFIGLQHQNYLEINLSTNGAWWAAGFSSYRNQNREKPEITMEDVFTNSDTNGNLVIASFSYKNLNFNGKYNIAAIIDKQHYSLNIAGQSNRPDFHLEELRKS